MAESIADQLTTIGREIAALNRRAQEIAAGKMARVEMTNLLYEVQEVAFDMASGEPRIVFSFYGPRHQRLHRVAFLDDEKK